MKEEANYTLSADDMEAMGLLVDRLDNASFAAQLPIPAELHKQALTSIVGEVRDELKALLQGKGFDPWDDL